MHEGQCLQDTHEKASSRKHVWGNHLEPQTLPELCEGRVFQESVFHKCVRLCVPGMVKVDTSLIVLVQEHCTVPPKKHREIIVSNNALALLGKLRGWSTMSRYLPSVTFADFPLYAPLPD